jgi:hypothetical protein
LALLRDVNLRNLPVDETLTSKAVHLLWLLLILTVSAAFTPVLHSWTGKRSRNSPRSEASLKNFEISRRGRRSVLECTFTYQVNGRRYLGKYSREGYKSELVELAESLQNGPLFTRYNPLRPDKFFLDPFQDVTEKG